MACLVREDNHPLSILFLLLWVKRLEEKILFFRDCSSISVSPHPNIIHIHYNKGYDTQEIEIQLVRKILSTFCHLVFIVSQVM